MKRLCSNWGFNMKIVDLEGTIMYKDTELCWFHYKNTFIEIKPIGISEEYTPFEFQDGYTKQAVIDWLFDRLPEDNRQGLEETCKEYGISMLGDDILHFNNDLCWIKYRTGPQTFEEVKVPGWGV